MIIGISIHNHLTTFFKHNSAPSPEQEKFFEFMGWLFDQLGNDAYRMNAHRLVESAIEYWQSPNRNQTKIKKYGAEFKKWNNIASWNDFLFSSPVENYIRPIHDKLKRIDIRNIEGMIAKSSNNPERVRQLTNMLKQLNTTDSEPDSSIVLTETIPSQKLIDCRSSTCTNTLLTYHEPLLICPVCGFANTQWTKTDS